MSQQVREGPLSPRHLGDHRGTIAQSTPTLLPSATAASITGSPPASRARNLSGSVGPPAVSAASQEAIKQSLGWTPLLVKGQPIGKQATSASFHFQSVMDMLASGKPIDGANDKGFTALGMGCQYGAMDAVDLLLGEGADPNKPQGEVGVTPLYIAVEYSNESLVAVLLKHSAAVDGCDITGKTPLIHACFTNNMAMAKLLLEAGADPNVAEKRRGFTALHFACLRGYTAIAQLLLEHKASPDQPTKAGETALHCAAVVNMPELTRTLVAAGANVEAFDHASKVDVLLQAAGAKRNGTQKWHENTPLLLACMLGHVHVVEELLASGASARATNSVGMGPLHCAATGGSVDIVRALLKNGALPSSITERGLSAIHIAAKNDFCEVLDALLSSCSYGVDDQDLDGNTALHMACDLGLTDVVARLLASHASEDVHNNRGAMPIELAAAKGHLAILENLLDQLPFSPTASYLGPSFVAACEHKHVDCVWLLLQRGANPLATNEQAKPAILTLKDVNSFNLSAVLRHVNAAKRALLELEASDAYWQALGPYIESIDLRHNRLHWLPTGLARLLPRLRQVHLDGNPLTSIPGANDSWDHVKAFLLDVAAQKDSLYCRHKLVVAGRPAAGKTTLVRALCANKGRTSCANNVATDGMQEAQNVVFQQQSSFLPTGKRWKGQVTYTIWDLGGQDVLYCTHQLFMCSSSIYLLVFDLAVKVEETMKHLDYWLNVIQLMGGNKPKIVLAGTHADLCTATQVAATMGALQERYCQQMFPDIASMHVVSSKKGNGIGDLKGKVDETAMASSQLHQVSDTWTLLLNELERLKRNDVKYLAWEDYEITARKYGVAQSLVPQVTRYLADVGTIVYFGNVRTCAQGLVVLNSQWLSQVVSCFVSIHKRWDTKGVIRDLQSKLANIFPESMYPAKIHQTLLEILDDFGIVHLLNSNEMLIPSLLPLESPSDTIVSIWGPAATPAGFKQIGRVIDFSFLPVGFFSYIQAAVLRSARLNRARCLAKWRSGLLLSFSFLVNDESSNALVLLKHAPFGVGGCRLEIYLRAVDKTFDSSLCTQSFVSILQNVDTVLEQNYNKRCNSLTRQRKVPCTHCMADAVLCSSPYLFALEHILRELLAHKTMVFCTNIRSSSRSVRIEAIAPDMVFKDQLSIEDKELEPAPDQRKILGRGAMGRVYLASYKGFKVAIKQVLQISDPEEFYQFQKEARLMRFLRHPNLVALLGTTARPPQLIIEFVPHGTLQDLIGENHTAMEDLTLRIRIAHDIAMGMRCMHGHNPPIAHLDLKSENIFITSLEAESPVVAKVGDFGIAQIMHSNLASRKGTWPYMAPEVLLSGSTSSYDASVDVFSFGIILFEIFAMKSDPYAEHKRDPRYCDSNGNFCDAKLLNGIIHENVRPQMSRHCPFADLIQRCWAHEPQRRPSFADLVDHFQPLLPFDVAEIQAATKFNGLTMLKSTKANLHKANVLISELDLQCLVKDIRPVVVAKLPFRAADLATADRALFVSHVTGHITMVKRSRMTPNLSEREMNLEALRNGNTRSTYLPHGLRMKTWKALGHSLEVLKIVEAADGSKTVWASTTNSLVLVLDARTGEIVWKLAMDDDDPPIIRDIEYAQVSPTKVQVWIGSVHRDLSALWVISVEDGQFSFDNRTTMHGVVSSMSLMHDHMLVAVSGSVCFFDIFTHEHVASWELAGVQRITRLLTQPKTNTVWTCSSNVINVVTVEMSAGQLLVTPVVGPGVNEQLSAVHSARITDLHTDQSEESVWSSSIKGDVIIWSGGKPAIEVKLDGPNEEVIKLHHWPQGLDSGAMVALTRYRQSNDQSWEYRLLMFEQADVASAAK